MKKKKILQKLGWTDKNDGELETILPYVGHKDIVKAVEQLQLEEEDKIINEFLAGFNIILRNINLDIIIEKTDGLFNNDYSLINMVGKPEYEKSKDHTRLYTEFLEEYVQKYENSLQRYKDTQIYKDKIPPMLYHKILTNLRFLYLRLIA